MRFRLLLAATFVAAAGSSFGATPWRIGTVELPPAIGLHTPQQGYYAVLLRRILKELEAEPQFVFLPAARIGEQVRSGQLDAGMPYLRTPAREREFWLTDSFYPARMRVFVDASSGWLPHDVTGLVGETGCALQGAQSPERLQRELEAGRLRLERVADLTSCFRMLQVGRVRFVVAGEHSGEAAAATLPAQGLKVRMADFVLSEEGVHLAISRQLPDGEQRMRAFNAAVRKLRAAGVLKELEALPLRPPAASTAR